MDTNHPSLLEVLMDIGGLGFVLGTVTMAAFPFAVPLLVLCALALPLLLPVLLVALLFEAFRRPDVRATVGRPRTAAPRVRPRAPR